MARDSAVLERDARMERFGATGGASKARMP